MEYRTLGKTGKEISLLSFGCMRFPKDEQEAAALVSAAIDAGVNYFETSNGYCEKTSERKVGLGVKARRTEVLVSTKSGVKSDTDGDAMRRNVEASLEQLQTDYLDFYQFWGLSWKTWQQARIKGGALEAIRTLQDEGVIRHLGFTSHDTPENVLKIMQTGEFESATLQYNIINVEMEQQIAYARQQGIGIVVMCPVAGGLLAGSSPKVREMFPSAGNSSASVDLALRFVWSNPGVATAPSGMERMSDLDENLRSVEQFKPLDTGDRERAIEVSNEFAALGKKFCTTCRYCTPCPSKVWIPDVFKLVNHARLYDLGESARARYHSWPAASLASACDECGECEPK